MDLNAMMQMMKSRGGNAPDVGSRTTPLNAPQGGGDQNQMLQLLLQLLLQQMGGVSPQGAPAPQPAQPVPNQPVM